MINLVINAQAKKDDCELVAPGPRLSQFALQLEHLVGSEVGRAGDRAQMPGQCGEGLKTGSFGGAGALGSLETTGKKTLCKKKRQKPL